MRAGDRDATSAALRTALAAHTAATALLVLLVAHVEIATRVLGVASLPFYWTLGALLRPLEVAERDPTPNARRAAQLYLALFALLGPAAHCNFLPWT